MKRCDHAVLILIGLGCFTMWGLGAAVVASGPLWWEWQVLARLNEYAVEQHWFVSLWYIVSRVGQPAVFQAVGLVVAGVFFVARQRQWGLTALVATAMVVPVERGLKLLAGRPRPSWGEPIVAIGGFGYPSGHAAASAVGCGLVVVACFVLGAGVWRWAGLVMGVVVVAAVGFARLALGVHSPTDVLGGWVVAAGLLLIAMATGRVLDRLSDGGPVTGVSKVQL